MTRLELYHNKRKQFSRKGPFFSILACILISVGFFVYYQNSIKIDSPSENLGRKVVIQLPNGQKVYTYEKLIYKKDGRIYYKGESNKIDLTGGNLAYKNWK